jgi:hypothetical protein
VCHYTVADPGQVRFAKFLRELNVKDTLKPSGVQAPRGEDGTQGVNKPSKLTPPGLGGSLA